jgi:hypothetical protein
MIERGRLERVDFPCFRTMSEEAFHALERDGRVQEVEMSNILDPSAQVHDRVCGNKDQCSVRFSIFPRGC